jgi:hypothetical protein
MSADRDGSQRLAEVLAEAIGRLDVASEPESVPDYLELISVASGIERQARSLLHEAVSSARFAGATWSAVGDMLGMSKQAAQKRFTPQRAATTSEDRDQKERILGPVTAFDEMAELGLAGRYGWHSVDFGSSFHRVVRSATQWEHVRVSMLTSRARLMRAEGWQTIGSKFPYTYLKRDLGVAALIEPSSEAWTPSTGA